MKASYDGMTRFEAARIFFQRFSNAAKASRIDNFYALTQFGMRTRPDYGVYRDFVTPGEVSNGFQQALNAINAYGGTPMWEALQVSIQALIAKRDEIKRQAAQRGVNCADPPMRIIVLTDGEANRNNLMNQVILQLIQHQIRLDAIFVSGQLIAPLTTAARMTGGYVFVPNSVRDADPIFESEAFYSAARRLYGPFRQEPVEVILNRVKSGQAPEGVPDTVVKSKAPEAGVHLGGKKFGDPWWIVAKYKSPEGLRDTRIIEELSYIIWNDDPSFSVYVDQDDIASWRILMKLPEGTRYANLWFQLYFHFPLLYPANGPLIRFIDPPYHVNISDEGRIILPEIQEYYEDSLHVFDIVEEIRILLMKRRQRSQFWLGDDDEQTQQSGGVNPLVDPNGPVDHAHEDAYRNPLEYRRLVLERNAKNGKAQESEITNGWTIERLPPDQREGLRGRHATPRHYLCPISQELMKNPVRSPTTRLCYDQAALQQHIQANPGQAECPVTFKKFTQNDLDAPADLEMAMRILDFMTFKR
jgi:ubiquitin-protein ligase